MKLGWETRRRQPDGLRRPHHAGAKRNASCHHRTLTGNIGAITSHSSARFQEPETAADPGSGPAPAADVRVTRLRPTPARHEARLCRVHGPAGLQMPIEPADGRAAALCCACHGHTLRTMPLPGAVESTLSSEPVMADQIVITEKTSQAKDVRAAVGSRYGDNAGENVDDGRRVGRAGSGCGAALATKPAFTGSSPRRSNAARQRGSPAASLSAVTPVPYGPCGALIDTTSLAAALTRPSAHGLQFTRARTH
jgi:hypothetical protein